jgi:hypothetical protein
MPSNEAVLGLRAHSGWAVAVAMSGGVPVLRRRIEMVTGTGTRARQPYHAAKEMKLVAAQSYLDRARSAAVELAAAAIRDIVIELQGRGFQVKRAAVLLGSGKPLPELAKILAAHPLIHTAEGVFFREVLMTACREVGLSASGVVERSLPADLVASAGPLGKILGPPWTQDEKLSAAAAILVASTKATPVG